MAKVTLTPKLHAGVISAEIPDQQGAGSTQVIFQVHRTPEGLDPRVTVTTMPRGDLKEPGPVMRRALQEGQAWLLVVQNTQFVIHLDDLRRADAETKPAKPV
jgi:hypothetical protein